MCNTTPDWSGQLWCPALADESRRLNILGWVCKRIWKAYQVMLSTFWLVYCKLLFSDFHEKYY